MALVTLTNLNVVENPAPLLSPISFEITFEVIAALKEDLEFKMLLAIGSEEKELESVLVGPVPVGVNRFVFTSDPLKPALIPAEDVLDVMGVLVTCSYRDKEFVRVGYFVHNEYAEPEVNENPPSTPDYAKLFRKFLVEKPRVTRFSIPWDEEEKLPDEAALIGSTENGDKPATETVVADDVEP
ncbi:histone chaperone asf1a-B [Cladochytrium replicatum]|nr:histone chaperone asf1a-B [Cladochytrium replicatum]